MNSPQFPSDAMNIPQSILDHYHAHYSNDTYHAFSNALADHLPGGTAHPDHVAVMNMLTDAAFERAGTEVYRGAAVQLGAALVQLNSLELCVLAEQHLRRFNPDHDESVLTTGLLHSLDTLRESAEAAVRAASDHHGWRGRVAFWWLSAVTYLLQATHAVLSESHSSYVQEKLSAAARCQRDGLSEGAAAGFVIAYQIMNWFVHFPPR